MDPYPPLEGFCTFRELYAIFVSIYSSGESVLIVKRHSRIIIAIGTDNKRGAAFLAAAWIDGKRKFPGWSCTVHYGLKSAVSNELPTALVRARCERRGGRSRGSRAGVVGCRRRRSCGSC